MTFNEPHLETVKIHTVAKNLAPIQNAVLKIINSSKRV